MALQLRSDIFLRKVVTNLIKAHRFYLEYAWGNKWKFF
jgi:hypothetical protein